MHWSILNNSKPGSGTECIVGHFIKGVRTPVFGVWKYYFAGEESYWLTKDGTHIPCNRSDNWCAVEDVIDAVGERIEDELRSAINAIKNGLDILH